MWSYGNKVCARVRLGKYVNARHDLDVMSHILHSAADHTGNLRYKRKMSDGCENEKVIHLASPQPADLHGQRLLIHHLEHALQYLHTLTQRI